VRYRVKDTDYERILEIFKAYDVRYFFYIGVTIRGYHTQDGSDG